MFSRRNFLRHADQDFSSLKNSLLCKNGSQNDFYEDKAFPIRVKDAACSFPGSVWKHFKEVVGDDPVCIHQLDSISSFIKGSLDIPWFIVLGTLIASSSDILRRIFPDIAGRNAGCEQSIFRVHLWKWGKWHEVVVDGRVPLDPETKSVLFTRSKISNEIWPSLLEKALAKLLGGFGNVCQLTLPDALVMCTGGVLYFTDLRTEAFLADASSERILYRRIKREIRNNALICCRIPVPNLHQSSAAPFGLVKGHFFTVLDAKTIPMLSIRGIIRGCGLRDKLMVVRLCDPLYQRPRGVNMSSSKRRGSHLIQKSMTTSLLRANLPVSQSVFLEHSSSFANASLTREVCNHCRILVNEGLTKAHVFEFSRRKKYRGKYIFLKLLIHEIRKKSHWEAEDGVPSVGEYQMSHPFSARLTPDEEFNLGLTEPRAAVLDGETRDSGQVAWLRVQDFVRFFIDVVICTNCTPSSANGAPSANGVKKRRRHGSGRWRKEERAKGKWSLGDTGTWLDRSGGGPHLASFLQNPQFSLTILKRGDVIVQLVQKGQMKNDVAGRDVLYSIGFSITKVEVNRRYRLHRTFYPVESSPFADVYHVSQKFTLTPGRYLIVPSSFNPGLEMDFLVRVLSKNGVKLNALMLDQPRRAKLMRFLMVRQYRYLTRVSIRKVICSDGSEMGFWTGRITVSVACEGETSRSWAVKMPDDAAVHTQLSWDLVGFDSVFYRKSLSSKIVIEVHKKGLFIPVLLGKCEVSAGAVDVHEDESAERTLNLTNVRRFRDIRDEDFHLMPERLSERRVSAYSICVAIKTVGHYRDL